MKKKHKVTKTPRKAWGKAEVMKVTATDSEQLRKMMGPGAVDQSVRNALHLCWTMLPDHLKNAERVEKEFRRIVDRALRDLREDQERFMKGPGAL